MADNGAEGAELQAGRSYPMMTMATAALLLLPLALVLKKLLYPNFDPREPPVLRPRLPVLGHIISLVRESGSFYARLYKEKPMPICTLPILHGKMYVANSPYLIAAAMCHGDISFEPFLIEASSVVLDLPKHHHDIFLQPGVLGQVGKTMASNLRQEALQKMNYAALEYLAGVLNTINLMSALELPDWFQWIKGTLSMATATALYGNDNMWDAEKLEDLWTFEKGMGLLMMKIAPNLVAPKAVAARKRMKDLIRPFYEAQKDENSNVAKILQDRAKYFRELGMPSEDLSQIEFLIPFAATLNTALNLFWTFAEVFSRLEYTERIRQEVLPVAVVTRSETGRDVTIDAKSLEADCPFLVACFREVLRLYSAQIGNRSVMKDATLEDADGRQYLLKKGTNMQWSASVTHFMPEIWGDDAASFMPERFVDVEPQEEKRRRGALIPFGGGRHLCPGRYFAQTETLGFVSVLALGFDVDGVKVPAAEAPPLGGATRRPARNRVGESIKISRRKGWEDVTWRFLC
ncbi:prostacyclin synthase [Colletotrichum orchidophilum]|uniref:Prostacyclin synthase n=1 Tax=Colletotrichum orchidophilum TaxID=1209926 RepID=A0A1G4BP15_9PEZI|nr:prostacyclin synthase [Colletotrichum orchidophilum]OHF03164.1 prostacyclin synthase [Colletotrichum orchidophilum]